MSDEVVFVNPDRDPVVAQVAQPAEGWDDHGNWPTEQLVMTSWASIGGRPRRRSCAAACKATIRGSTSPVSLRRGGPGPVFLQSIQPDPGAVAIPRLAAVIAGDGQIGVSYAAKNGLRL